MPKFQVEYKHVEETTYTEWIEADSRDDAIEQAEADPQFTTTKDVQGIELIDFKVIAQTD